MLGGDAGGGFLGPKYQPFNIGSEGGLPTFSVSNMEASKEAKRHDLRAFVEDKYATESKSDSFLRSIRASQIGIGAGSIPMARYLSHSISYVCAGSRL